MNDQPFVTIIVPVHNGEKTIAACIKSLFGQDYPKDKYEIIVIDNNSKDKTADVIKNYLVKYLFESKIQSSYAARNAGIKSARGEIFAFIDADCVADKEWLKKGVACFAQELVGCVGGKINSAQPRNYIEEYLADKEVLSQKRKESPFILSYAKTANAFYRKEVFEKVGLFEERWVSGGDADLSWRMQLNMNYKINFSDKAIVFHKHRSTLRRLFQQNITWGKGYKALQNKYPNEVKKRKFRQRVWTCWRLTYIVFAIAPFFIFRKESMSKDKVKYYLDLLSFAGWEIGKLIG